MSSRTIVSFLLLNAAAFAQPASVEARARAILDKHCLSCHGGERHFAGLDVRSPESLKEVIVPGKPEDSLLIDLIVEGKMPAGGERLTRAEIATLKAWVRAGARPAVR